MIVTQCPHCRKRLKAQDEYHFKTIKCPSCGKKVQVITESEAAVAVLARQKEKEKQAVEEAEKKRQRALQERFDRAGDRAKLLIPIPERCPQCGNDNIENLYVKRGTFYLVEEIILFFLLIFIVVGVYQGCWPEETTTSNPYLAADYLHRAARRRIRQDQQLYVGIFFFFVFIAIFMWMRYRKFKAQEMYVCIRCGHEFKP